MIFSKLTKCLSILGMTYLLVISFAFLGVQSYLPESIASEINHININHFIGLSDSQLETSIDSNIVSISSNVEIVTSYLSSNYLLYLPTTSQDFSYTLLSITSYLLNLNHSRGPPVSYS